MFYKLLNRLSETLSDKQYFKIATYIERLNYILFKNQENLNYANTYSIYQNHLQDLSKKKTKINFNYPVFVINRDIDKERFKKISRRCEKLKIDITRFDAVDTMKPDFDFKPYSEYIGNSFWGSQYFKRGAIGCFLSHLKLWKHIIENNIDYAIILEDDAIPIVTFPSDFESLNNFSKADLVFINSRTSRFISSLNHNFIKDFTSFDIYPLRDCFSFLSHNGELHHPGADGYVLTKSGADKLIKIISEAKITCGVDWFLTLHSLHEEKREKLMRNSLESKHFEIFSKLELSKIALNSYILYPPLAKHGSARSVISHQDRKNIITRSQMAI